MIRYYTVIILLAVFFTRAHAQEPVFEIKPIRSIDIGAQQYDDLRFLDTLLKGKRIVLLGEESHFDGSSLIARQRIIDYLYRQLGYKNLCLEYDFFDVQKAYNEIFTNRDSANGVLAYLTNSFSHILNKEDSALAKTITQSKGGLKLFGLDIIPGSVYSNAFYHDFPEFIGSIVDYQRSQIKKLFEHFALKGHYSPRKMDKILADKNQMVAVIASGKRLLDELGKLKAGDLQKAGMRNQLSFYEQQIRSRIAYYQFMQVSGKYYANKPRNSFAIYKPNEIRDSQMADNFFWLLNQDTTARFIVTLSSFHISRNLRTISPVPKEIDTAYRTFGDYLYEKYPSLAYSVAFISYHGYRGHPLANQQREWFEKPENSVEQILHNYQLPYAFVDIRSGPNSIIMERRDFLMQPTFEGPYKHKWNKSYDAVFFIDRMEEVKFRAIINRMTKVQPYVMPKGW